jgi:hypothetical protein
VTRVCLHAVRNAGKFIHELAEALAMPILTRNQRDRDEIEQRDAEWEWEREHARRERRLDTPPISYTDIDARIASALAAERQANDPCASSGG